MIIKEEENTESKPCFSFSKTVMFLNLHNSASEKSASVVHLNANDKNINQFIINSGCTDGKTIINTSKVDFDEFYQSNTVFNNSQMEVGIILDIPKLEIGVLESEYKDLELTISKEKIVKIESKINKIRNNNKRLIDADRKLILDGINEYFNWFAGKDTPKFNEDELEIFIPDYNDGKVQIKTTSNSNSIKSLEEDFIATILRMYVEKPEDYVKAEPNFKKYEKKLKDIENNPNYQLRIGFKVGYTII